MISFILRNTFMIILVHPCFGASSFPVDKSLETDLHNILETSIAFYLEVKQCVLGKAVPEYAKSLLLSSALCIFILFNHCLSLWPNLAYSSSYIWYSENTAKNLMVFGFYARLFKHCFKKHLLMEFLSTFCLFSPSYAQCLLPKEHKHEDFLTTSHLTAVGRAQCQRPQHLRTSRKGLPHLLSPRTLNSTGHRYTNAMAVSPAACSSFHLEWWPGLSHID